MSKLERLIQELCPCGAEYYFIGDICDTITDFTAAGSFADIAKNVQYINNGKGFAQLIRTTDLKSKFENQDRFVYVNEHAFNYLWRVNLAEEAIVMPNVGNCGEVYYVTAKMFPSENNVLGPNAILIKSSNANIRYLYHLFLTNEFQKKLAKIVSPVGQTKFNKTNFKMLKIPIPPIEVQDEIVRILDNFTELTAELKAELTARKKQYEYYRDSILTFSDEVPRVKLGELCSLITKQTGFDYSNHIKDSLMMRETENSVPYIQTKFFTGKVFNYNTDYFVPQEIVKHFPKITLDSKCLLFSIVGASIGNVGLFPNDRTCFLGGAICVAKVKPEYNIDYLYYCIEANDVQRQIRRKTKGAGQATITVEDIREFTVPLPSIEVQNKIVKILDNFSNLCNDIYVGLPAEIEVRQKQYEYYRDKLLTFKPLDEEKVAL